MRPSDCGQSRSPSSRRTIRTPASGCSVFSKTTGFRHDSIDEGIAAIRAMGRANEFQVDATEDAGVFRDSVLARYDTVVFLSTTGDPLNNIQQAAFERYIRAGGGFTGVHAAADTEYDWNWYGHLVGGYFLSHPPGTPTATVDVEDEDEPLHRPAAGPLGAHGRVVQLPLAGLRRTRRAGRRLQPARGRCPRPASRRREDLRRARRQRPTDDDHPIAWCQPYDGGRSWYTGMGHTAGVVLGARLRGASAGRHRDHGGRGLLARVHERGARPYRPPPIRRPATRRSRSASPPRAATQRARRSSTPGTSVTAAGRSGRTRRTSTSRPARTWRR